MYEWDVICTYTFKHNCSTDDRGEEVDAEGLRDCLNRLTREGWTIVALNPIGKGYWTSVIAKRNRERHAIAVEVKRTLKESKDG